MTSDISSWHPAGAVLKRRGYQDRIGGFYEFTPGAVKPLSYKDEALGIGIRNVGPRVSSFTPHYGDITLTPGMQLSGLEIFGRITGRGDSTTKISDCIIRGNGTRVSAVGGQSLNLGGAVIEWSRIELDNNQEGFSDAVEGGNYTLRYCELLRGVDGLHWNTLGNATAHCCRIANGFYTAWWNDGTDSVRTANYTDADGVNWTAPFPAQSSGDTHGDGLQIAAGTGWVLRGCYIGGDRTTTYASKLDPTIPAQLTTIKGLRQNMDFNTSAVLMASASAATPIGALLEDNWFQGGAARVNLAYKSYDTLAGVTIRNNRFIRTSFGYYLYVQSGVTAVLSNNIYDDTEQPVSLVNW